MAVVKSLKNKKHKREWVKNLKYTLHLQHKSYKFNFYKNKKNRYAMHRLNKISRSYIKQKSITLFFINVSIFKYLYTYSINFKLFFNL